MTEPTVGADDGSSQHRAGPATRSSAIGRFIAVTAAVVAVLFLVTQVSVDNRSTETTRACGSIFDTIVDRTGWETWWAADLDEPDASVRRSLVRSTECPAALNTRLWIAGATAAVSLALGLLAWQRGDPGTVRRRRGTDRNDRLSHLGTLSFRAGTLLVALGLGGLVLLVADREATLFLYVDRRVVAIVGLVVLVPPTALLLLGRALSILGGHLEDKP